MIDFSLTPPIPLCRKAERKEKEKVLEYKVPTFLMKILVWNMYVFMKPLNCST